MLQRRSVAFSPQMRDPEQVTALTSSQEDQLLRNINNTNAFVRKMTAHSVLYTLHFFLVDGKRVIVNKREKLRRDAVSRDPISFYAQMLRWKEFKTSSDGVPKGNEEVL